MFFNLTAIIAMIQIIVSGGSYQTTNEDLITYSIAKAKNKSLPNDIIHSIVRHWIISPAQMNMNQLIECRDSGNKQCENLVKQRIKDCTENNTKSLIFVPSDNIWIFKTEKSVQSFWSSLDIWTEIKMIKFITNKTSEIGTRIYIDPDTKSFYMTFGVNGFTHSGAVASLMAKIIKYEIRFIADSGYNIKDIYKVMRTQQTQQLIINDDLNGLFQLAQIEMDAPSSSPIAEPSIQVIQADNEHKQHIIMIVIISVSVIIFAIGIGIGIVSYKRFKELKCYEVNVERAITAVVSTE